MLDLQHLPGNLNNQRQQMFVGQNQIAGTQWQTWVKPKGIGWVHIFLVGRGGNGGTGVIGANSVSAGGGGGGSGGQTSVLVPAWSIPDTLFLSLGGLTSSASTHSYVCIYPATSTAYYILAIANAGGNGGNASAGTGGSAGIVGAAATLGTMPVAAAIGVSALLGGNAGIIGGGAVSGGTLSVPATGLRVTGGTGGGGLPAAAATGTVGGSFSATGPLPPVAAPAGQATATLPPNTPDSGFIFQPSVPGLVGLMNYGGVGGGSTHGTATGGGLVQMKGGDGAPGCGGGGSGGALTGSTAAAGGLGGPSFCVITCW